MTTWTCKAASACIALTVLAGCEGGLADMGEAFVADVSALNLGDITGGLGGITSGPDVALSQSSMAFGAVTLVPPQGFCIDKRSLKQQFALMARCDKLGAPSAAGSAPVGIITASFTGAPTGAALPAPEDIALALGLQTVTNPARTENFVTFRASGGPSVAGASIYHWRATARIGTQIVGLALHGPKDGRALSEEGRTMLTELIAASSPENGETVSISSTN